MYHLCIFSSLSLASMGDNISLLKTLWYQVPGTSTRLGKSHRTRTGRKEGGNGKTVRQAAGVMASWLLVPCGYQYQYDVGPEVITS